MGDIHDVIVPPPFDGPGLRAAEDRMRRYSALTWPTTEAERAYKYAYTHSREAQIMAAAAVAYDAAEKAWKEATEAWEKLVERAWAACHE